MKSTTAILSASTFLFGAVLTLPAMAQDTAPPPSTPTTPTPTPTPTPTTTPPIGTATTTAADRPADTTAGPTTAEPPQRDTVTVTRSMTPNRPLLVVGGVLLVGTYVPTAILASTEGRSVEDRNLLIPVVGPWLNLADRRCDGCDNEPGNVAMIVGTGVLQGVGAGMMIMSFLVPEKIEAATIQAGPVKLHFAPTQYGRSGMGLGTVGVF